MNQALQVMATSNDTEDSDDNESEMLLQQDSSNGVLEGNQGYRNFVDKLAESNVDEYVDLPMIAVMGDTSSGRFLQSSAKAQSRHKLCLTPHFHGSFNNRKVKPSFDAVSHRVAEQ